MQRLLALKLCLSIVLMRIIVHAAMRVWMNLTMAHGLSCIFL